LIREVISYPRTKEHSHSKNNGSAYIDAVIATDKGEKSHKTAIDESERNVVKADFTYSEADNTFSCPEGQVLEMSLQQTGVSRISASLCPLPAAQSLLSIRKRRSSYH
jgi:hypothetical protein